MTSINEFEKVFKEAFPDIYELANLAKPLEQGGGGEIHLWTLMELIMSMHKQQITGTITVEYNQGRINHIIKKESLIANKSYRPKS